MSLNVSATAPGEELPLDVVLALIAKDDELKTFGSDQLMDLLRKLDAENTVMYLEDERMLYRI